MNLLSQSATFESQFPLTGRPQELRKKSLAMLHAQGAPTRKSEAYKYTSLKGLVEVPWIPAALSSPLVSSSGAPGLNSQVVTSIATLKSDDFTNIVFVNGHHIASLSDSLPPEAMWSEETDVSEAEWEAKDTEKSFAETLQDVYFLKRYTLKIVAGVVLQKPIHILVFNEPVSVAKKMVQIHLTVSLGARSKASLVESFFGIGPHASSYFINTISKFSLESNAFLTHLRLQRDSDLAFHLGQSEFVQQADSNLETLHLALGGQLARHQLQVQLKGPGASSQVLGATVGRKSQHHDHQTSIQHLSGHCTTQQIYKGLLDGKSRVVFNGGIRIASGAQKASSEQINANLLLSSEAEADSKPQLEIDADDVKATHGSTCGPLEAEELFYLLSRGISKSKSIELMSFGFVAETLERISDPSLQAWAQVHLGDVFRKLDSVQIESVQL